MWVQNNALIITSIMSVAYLLALYNLPPEPHYLFDKHVTFVGKLNFIDLPIRQHMWPMVFKNHCAKFKNLWSLITPMQKQSAAQANHLRNECCTIPVVGKRNKSAWALSKRKGRSDLLLKAKVTRQLVNWQETLIIQILWLASKL